MRMIKLLAIVMMVAICLCGINIVIGESGSSRIDSPVTSFKGGQSTKTLEFLTGGSNSNVEIELPTDCRITDASMNIIGEDFDPGFADTILDHTSSTNQAWWGEDSTPSTKAPSTLKKNTFSNTEYSNVQYVDATINTFVPSNDGAKVYAMHQFRMNVTGYIAIEPYMLGVYTEGQEGVRRESRAPPEHPKADHVRYFQLHGWNG